MHTLRALPPEINPCPPGPRGGQYQPLDSSDVQRIVDNAMRILAELGMGQSPQVLTAQATSKGATVNSDGRLCFPRSMVEDIIDGACKRFAF